MLRTAVACLGLVLHFLDLGLAPWLGVALNPDLETRRMQVCIGVRRPSLGLSPRWVSVLSSSTGLLFGIGAILV